MSIAAATSAAAAAEDSTPGTRSIIRLREKEGSVCVKEEEEVEEVEEEDELVGRSPGPPTCAKR